MGYIAVFLGMLVMVNAHWVILQTVAWGGMLITYTARSGLETGLQETFDGEHPCPLCCAIKEAKSQEQASEKLNAYIVDVRLVAIESRAADPLEIRFHHYAVYHKQLLANDRSLDPPPTPPPRSILS